MNMQRSQEKNSILHYLPQNQRAKLMKLIQRLAEETAEKQKYRGLYEQSQERYEKLQKKYEQLEQYTMELKSQIATSRMAIQKAKQVYIASKSSRKQNKKINHSDSENSDQQWETVEVNKNHNKGSISKKNHTKQIQQGGLSQPIGSQTARSGGYLFEDLENPRNKKIAPQNFEQASNSQNQEDQDHARKGKKILYPGLKKTPPLPTQNYFMQQTQRSLRKSKYSSSKKISDGENSFFMSSGSKKDEINNLKKQIESLTESMQKKKRSQLPYNEKMKKCEEIKNRYIKNKQRSLDKRNEEKNFKQYSSESSNQYDDEIKKMEQSKMGNRKLEENKVKDSSSRRRQKNPISSRKQQDIVQSQAFGDFSYIQEEKDRQKSSRNLKGTWDSYIGSSKKKTTQRKQNQIQPDSSDQIKKDQRKVQYDQSLFDVIAALNP